MNTRYDPRADKITVAITEARIVSQRDHEHPSLAYVETDTTLEALAVVAARIAFETKIADTAAKGATFAEQHAEMVGQNSQSAPEERRPAFFRPRARRFPDGRERPRRNGWRWRRTARCFPS